MRRSPGSTRSRSSPRTTGRRCSSTAGRCARMSAPTSRSPRAPQLSRGRHTIAVRVDWRDPVRQADEGWARAWFNFGGLNRPVTLARLGRTELGALTVRTRLRGGDRAQVEVALRARNRGNARTMRLRGSLRHGGRTAFAGVRARRRRRRNLACDARDGDDRRPGAVVARGAAALRAARRRPRRGDGAAAGRPARDHVGRRRAAAQRRAARPARRGAAARRARPRRRDVGGRRAGHRRRPEIRERERDALPAAALTEHARAPRRRRHPRLAGRRPVGAGGPLARRARRPRSRAPATARCGPSRPSSRTRRSSRGRSPTRSPARASRASGRTSRRRSRACARSTPRGRSPPTSGARA